MEEMNKKQGPTLNLGKIWQSLKKYRKLYYTVIPATIVVVWLLTLCYPDYYKCKVTLVPESSSSGNLWGISDGGSWLNSWPIKGRTNYPLLFDRQYQAKPVVNEIIKLYK